MKPFTFHGTTKGFMLTIARIVIAIAILGAATSVVTTFIDHVATVILFSALSAVIYFFIILWGVNRQIKYLIEHTAINGKQLHFKGEPKDILGLLITAFIVWILLLTTFGLVVFILQSTGLLGGAIGAFLYAIATMINLLAIIYFSIWVMIRFYAWAVENTYIEGEG